MHIEMDLPESALPDFAFGSRQLSSDQFASEMRLAAALKWYETGMISQGKAAVVAGISREMFLLSAGRFGVSVVQTSPAEMAEELGRD